MSWRSSSEPWKDSEHVVRFHDSHRGQPAGEASLLSTSSIASCSTASPKGFAFGIWSRARSSSNKAARPVPNATCLVKGEIQVSQRVDGKDVLVDVCDDGDIFGVRALLGDRPYAATTQAKADTLLYVLSKDQLHELVAAAPRVAMFFAADFAGDVPQLGETNRLVAVREARRHERAVGGRRRRAPRGPRARRADVQHRNDHSRRRLDDERAQRRLHLDRRRRPAPAGHRDRFRPPVEGRWPGARRLGSHLRDHERAGAHHR